MAHITCPDCGELLPSSANFCPNCGCPLHSEEIKNGKTDNEESKQLEERVMRMRDIWVCPDCGLEMTEEKDNCPNCACPNSLFVHKQVEGKTALKTEYNNVKKKTPRWVYFVIIGLVAYGGLVVADGISRHRSEKAEEAAREAVREAEYQKRVEEEQRQKKRKEESIRELSNYISGNSYSRYTTSIYSDATRDLQVYSFDSNGKGSLMTYLAGFNKKGYTTISWWINDDEELVISNSDGTEYFTIRPGYIETDNGVKFFREY